MTSNIKLTQQGVLMYVHICTQVRVIIEVKRGFEELKVASGRLWYQEYVSKSLWTEYSGQNSQASNENKLKERTLINHTKFISYLN